MAGGAGAAWRSNLVTRADQAIKVGPRLVSVATARPWTCTPGRREVRSRSQVKPSGWPCWASNRRRR